jgi:hypothetical protein
VTDLTASAQESKVELVNMVAGALAATPGSELTGLATTAITGKLTLTKTGTTARTATFPNKAGTVAMSDDLHAAVTLSTAANSNLLSLSTQEIGLDTQAEGLVFAGPTTGAAAAPTFRSLVAGDIPTLNQNTTGSAGKLADVRTLTATAANTFAIGNVGFLASTETITLAKANAVNTSTNLLVMATAAIDGGAAGVFALFADVTVTGHTLAVGAPIYVSAATDGAITTTAPGVGENVVRIIGYAIDANTIRFDPDKSWTVTAGA